MKKANFYVETIKESNEAGTIIVYPLPKGFGFTLGNVYRRVLLSSMEGAAATYVKVKDVSHPFTTIKGLKEDVLALLLNLKQLRFKFTGEAEQKLVLKKKGPAKLTGADLKDSPLCQVINKKQYLGELAKGSELSLELYVNQGIGYEPSEEKEEKEFGLLPLDSLFTPVKQVSIKVEGARVGRRTNYDKLILKIETDGSLKASNALNKATEILLDQLLLIQQGGAKKPKTETKPEEEVARQKRLNQNEMMVDELDLPTRVINALIKHNIETVAQLKEMDENDLSKVKGLGKKSIEELKQKLDQL